MSWRAMSWRAKYWRAKYWRVVARLQGNYVAGLGALGALFDLELDTLAFCKRAVALGLDGRLMHKDIRASVTRYKAIALACIEPFDGAGNSLTHRFVSFHRNM